MIHLIHSHDTEQQILSGAQLEERRDTRTDTIGGTRRHIQIQMEEHVALTHIQ